MTRYHFTERDSSFSTGSFDTSVEDSSSSSRDIDRSSVMMVTNSTDPSVRSECIGSTRMTMPVRQPTLEDFEIPPRMPTRQPTHGEISMVKNDALLSPGTVAPPRMPVRQATMEDIPDPIPGVPGVEATATSIHTSFRNREDDANAHCKGVRRLSKRRETPKGEIQIAGLHS